MLDVDRIKDELATLLDIFITTHVANMLGVVVVTFSYGMQLTPGDTLKVEFYRSLYSGSYKILLQSGAFRRDGVGRILERAAIRYYDSTSA